MTAILHAIGLRGALAIVALLAAWWWWDEAGDAKALNEQLAARVGGLQDEVRQGQQAVTECARTNETNMQALRQCNTLTGDLARRTRELDDALAAARDAVTVRRRERSAEDAELRRREAPLTVDQANALWRARGEGWLWQGE